MDHFHYRDGRLCGEGVSVDDIVARVGTPVYVYSTATIERHYRVFRAAVDDLDPLICYAVKANANIAVIRTLARLGAGADVVSGGELQSALAAGVAPERIVFSGVGKSRDEMAAALKAGVFQLNVESETELEALAEVAASLGRIAPAALRVNPDVDAGTHVKITTGRRENKFGIDWTTAPTLFARAAVMPSLSLHGVAVHIGSQLADLEPFRQAFQRMRDLVVMLRADGHAVRTLDLGGGLGIPYGDEASPMPSPAEYAGVVRHAVADLDCRLILEPGRLLVGNAGVLVTRVLYVKPGATRTFVIVDAAMNDLLRPALYNARHVVVPVRESSATDRKADTVDVVGPICESGDCLAAGVALPPLAPGDLLAIRTAGAYGAAMASTYNLRPLVAEVMVHGDDLAVVAERGTIESILDRQRLPAWLDDEATVRSARRAAGQ